MIEFSTGQLTDLEELNPDPTVRVDPPAINPFLSPASISVAGEPGNFQITVVKDAPTEVGFVDAEKLVRSVVDQAMRDVERYPKSARARLNLGIALLNGHRNAEAAEQFRLALGLDPRNYAAAINLARASVLREHLDEAQSLYENIEGNSDSGPALLMGRAFVLLRHGGLTDAEQLLRRAVQLDENASLPRYHLGVVLLARGRHREAIAQLKAATRNGVRSASAHQALGIAYAATGDLKRAESSLRIALSLAPGMSSAAHALANIYLRQSDPESAIRLLSEFVQKGGHEDVGTRELLAQAYENLRRYGDARGQLRMALELLKDQDTASLRQRSLLMNNIGYMYDRENTPDRASEWVAQALRLCPDADPILYTNLAKLYLRQRRAMDAGQVLTRGRMFFPRSREIRTLNAIALQRQRLIEEAARELQELVRSEDRDAEAYALLGWILVDEKKEVESGIRIMEEGAVLFGGDPRLLNNLAYGYLMKGDSVAARKLLTSIRDDRSIGNRVTLMATWGLLRIWEGAVEEGVTRYLDAERLASEAGEGDLARVVRQKSHLELARACLRAGDLHGASREISKGLRIRGGTDCYRADLESLETFVSSQSPPASD